MTQKMKRAMKRFTQCPFCAGKIYKRYSGLRDRLDTTEETFTLWECRSCGAGMLNPMPVGDVSRYYPTHYLSAESDAEPKGLDVEKWYRYNQYNYDFKLVERATGLLPKDMHSYVDIGCGSGERVAYVDAQGCRESYGVDKFDFAKHQAKKFKIINSEVVDFKPQKKLQVVTLFHVLEHIEDPLQLLKHIKAHIIKRDGYLVIQVPNYDSIERHVFREKWFSFDVPRHTWQFNQKVVADLLDKAGYSVKGSFKTNAPLHPVTIVPSINRDLDIQRIWVKKNAHPLRTKAMTLAWVAMTLLTIPLTIAQNIVGRSSMLTVVAQPNKD